MILEMKVPSPGESITDLNPDCAPGNYYLQEILKTTALITVQQPYSWIQITLKVCYKKTI